MLPSISNRINSLIKALEKTITPAIDPNNGLAQEQVSLVIGHLKMIEQQWDDAYRYEKGSFENMQALGEKLKVAADGGSATQVATSTLTETLASLSGKLSGSASEINEHTSAVGHNVDALINAGYRDGTPDFKKQLTDLVLNYGAKQSSRERVWFGATNLDPDSGDLVSMDEMLSTDIYMMATKK